MPKIMIVEDEAAIREELSLLLENAGYSVVAPAAFHNIPELAEAERPDLILLDVGLPDKSGYSICAELRRRTRTPIIFVTSRNNAMDELNALSMGGDDYITKPYNIPVLLARIAAMLRRSGGGEEILDRPDFRLHLGKSVIEANERQAELTKNELKILHCLAKRPGEIVARADIIEYLWDNQVYIDDNTLSVNMTRLREKLAALGLADLIVTKRGQGYKIN